MLIDHQHPLWRDFQHLHMRIDTTIIFPAGAGGHFISGLLGIGYRREQTETNSWEAAIPWLMLDENSIAVQQGCAVPQIDETVLYARALGMSNNPQHWGNRSLAIGHEAPYLTSNILSFHTNELISITVRPEDCWIPRLLEVRKNRLTTNYDFKTYYLIELLNSNRYQGNLDNIEYLNAMATLSPHLSGLDISATALGLKYFCDTKYRSLDPADTMSWDAWISTEVSFTDYYLYHSCDYFMRSRAWCGERAGLYTTVDYRDLFFGLCLPNSGMLRNVDISAIAEYSQKNLAILDQTIGVMPVSQRDVLYYTLDQLKKQLEQARP